MSLPHALGNGDSGWDIRRGWETHQACRKGELCTKARVSVTDWGQGIMSCQEKVAVICLSTRQLLEAK